MTIETKLETKPVPKHRGKDKTKRVVTASHSALQRINGVVQHAIYFRLHYFPTGCLAGLTKSAETYKLIAEHTRVTKALKESIKADYATQKRVLAIKAKLKQNIELSKTKK